MEYPVVNFDAQILANNIYKFSILLELNVETGLEEKLSQAVREFWQMSGELFQVRLSRGQSSQVQMELFLEVGFHQSPGSFWDIFFKVKRIFSTLGKVKLKAVENVSPVAVVKTNWRAIISDYLKAHWIEISIGFVAFVILLALLKKKQ